MKAGAHPREKRWTKTQSIWTKKNQKQHPTVFLPLNASLFWGAHQEDDVGVLVESSGHADPLSLPSTQVDALSHSSTITLKHGQKWSRQTRANDAKRWAYPLSDLSLVTERQQVDVRLQRAGVNHRFVPGKDGMHNIKKGDHCRGRLLKEDDFVVVPTSVCWKGCQRWCFPPRWHWAATTSGQRRPQSTCSCWVHHGRREANTQVWTDGPVFIKVQREQQYWSDWVGILNTAKPDVCRVQRSVK